MLTADPLPLAAASLRLKGRPGRPRLGTLRAHSPAQTRINSGPEAGAPVTESGRPSPVAPVTPRLLDLRGASGYCSLAPVTLLDLEAAGSLRRVRVVVRGREIRRRLYDVRDLDRLIDGWRA